MNIITRMITRRGALSYDIFITRFITHTNQSRTVTQQSEPDDQYCVLYLRVSRPCSNVLFRSTRWRGGGVDGVVSANGMGSASGAGARGGAGARSASGSSSSSVSASEAGGDGGRDEIACSNRSLTVCKCPMESSLRWPCKIRTTRPARREQAANRGSWRAPRI